MLNLYLLGGYDLFQDGAAPVELKARKALALLVWLAMHPDKSLGRDTATGLLWGDRPQQQANASLSQAIYTLRRILGTDENAVIQADQNSIRFTMADAKVDAFVFSQLVRKGTLESLSAGAKLYRGDFLEGFRSPTQEFEEWMHIERTRLRTEAIDALTALLSERKRVGDTKEAMETASQLLKLDQYSEIACRTLMLTHAERGQASFATSLYDTLHRRLSEDLGMSPSTETEQLREKIQRGDIDPGGHDPSVAGADAELTSGNYPRRTRPGPTAILALISLLVVGAFVVVAYGRYQDTSSRSPPSIAVLPFVNLSKDPAQEYISSGITDDLTTGLAKLSGITLIARALDKDQEKHPTASYYLEGGTRRDGERLRVNARLVEAESGKVLWTESYDGAATDVMRLQDLVVTDALGALSIRLTSKEAGRLASGAPGSVAAYDLYLLGLAAYYRRTPDENARAVTFYKEALAEDANYLVVRVALAKAYFRAAFEQQAYADALNLHWTEAFVQARQLLEDDTAQSTAEVHELLSWLALRRRHYSVAVAEAERALNLQPGSAEAMEALAEALIYSGEVARGASRARDAIKRNPSLPVRPYYLLGLADFSQNKIDASIINLERALEFSSEAPTDILGLLAAAYAVAGNADTARALFDKFSASIESRPRRAWTTSAMQFANPRVHTWQRPDLTEAVYLFPFSNQEAIDRLTKGFRIAGALPARGGFFATSENDRLSGRNARDLLFGARIDGKALSLAEKSWSQIRTKNGFLEGDKLPTLQVDSAGIGSSSIENDQLCDLWETTGRNLINCASIFRISDPDTSRYWGDYFLATELGAYPFRVTIQGN